MKFCLPAVILAGVMLCFPSCQESSHFRRISYQLDSYSSMRLAEYEISPQQVRSQIVRLAEKDKSAAAADKYVRNYYLSGGGLLWIDRHGVDDRVDTLLAYLQTVRDMGFSPDKFYLNRVAEDRGRMRSLDFDGNGNSASDVLARLEYYATKAYVRYASGQRYGFTNPAALLNRVDVRDSDSVRVTYRQLFDVEMEHGGLSFYASAIGKVRNDSVSEALRDAQPVNKVYYDLLRQLRATSPSTSYYKKLLCNMERCRWRQKDYPQNHGKYVLVNLPSYHLRAVDGDSVLEMRIGCGTLATKTPLLNSRIKRMEVNPQWVIPHSIVKNDITRHAGDSSYFARRRYYITDKSTGKRMNASSVSAGMLLSGKYRVAQEGGAGNSLGRVVFRFDNNFSVFLHDTSTPAFFSRDNRGVSHGCVRVEKPFELAVFLLSDKNEELIGKIKYSMSADVGTAAGKQKSVDASKLIRSKSVEPQVPLFICYYTVYPDTHGTLRDYPDIYGYDGILLPHLNIYM